MRPVSEFRSPQASVTIPNTSVIAAPLSRYQRTYSVSSQAEKATPFSATSPPMTASPTTAETTGCVSLTESS